MGLLAIIRPGLAVIVFLDIRPGMAGIVLMDIKPSPAQNGAYQNTSLLEITQ